MRWLALCFLVTVSPASALEITLPGATLQRAEDTPADSVRLPDAIWSAASPAPLVDGAIRRQAYRIPGGARTTLQLLEPLREDLLADGFTEVFTCADAACGGFDFRFQLDLLGEPDMHVDFGDYRYLLMRRGSGAPHTVSIVTSRSQSAGFVHITEVSEAVFEETVVTSAPTGAASEPAQQADLIETLQTSGHAVLEDLDFPSGSSDLGPGPFQSLAALAAWMAATPGAEIALVGHTDAVGSLEANTALSERRAQSVARRLVDALGADAARITAEGAGYLSPRDTNQSESGRARNRRVEVILLSLG